MGLRTTIAQLCRYLSHQVRVVHDATVEEVATGWSVTPYSHETESQVDVCEGTLDLYDFLRSGQQFPDTQLL